MPRSHARPRASMITVTEPLQNPSARRGSARCLEAGLDPRPAPGRLGGNANALVNGCNSRRMRVAHAWARGTTRVGLWTTGPTRHEGRSSPPPTKPHRDADQVGRRVMPARRAAKRGPSSGVPLQSPLAKRDEEAAVIRSVGDPAIGDENRFARTEDGRANFSAS